MKYLSLLIAAIAIIFNTSNAQVIGYAQTVDNVNSSSLQSGAYQFNGYPLPDNTHDWVHLWAIRHSNTSNNHQLQIASTYSANDRLFFRKVQKGLTGATESWNELATRGTNLFSGQQTINGILQTYNKDNSGATWDNLRLWSEGENSYLESNGDEKGLVIRSNGGNKISLMSNVGIGTQDTHGYELAVNGKIRASEIKVEAAPWPDYVFTKEHQLPSLTYLESYIKSNNHLPEIPSAKEVESDGVSLGDMNAKLLKKIEEMTLYILDINKQVQSQQQEISELKKQINKK